MILPRTKSSRAATWFLRHKQENSPSPNPFYLPPFPVSHLHPNTPFTMARIVPSLTVFFSFLFFLTLTVARDLQNPFSEPQPHSEPVNLPEPKTHHGTVAFTVDTIDPVPLTFLRFRPINRHFHHFRESTLPLSLRSSRRRFHHGHRLQIPYGNDAIVLDNAAARRIHPRWVTVHADSEPRVLATEEHVDSAHEHHHRGENQHHHQHREENSFAKKIRKFLNLFWFSRRNWICVSDYNDAYIVIICKYMYVCK